jgi:hypothetical protein
MAIAKGVAKKLAYKRETTWGTPAGPTGAKYLRRVTANFNLTKETYESAEIRTDYQISDMRHGVRSAEGSLNGELSPSAYADFMASVVARDFTTGGVTTGASVTIAASGAFYTITRAAGSFLADGFFVGNVVRLSGAGLNVANAANNLLIASMTATVLTVVALSGVALVAEGPIASTDVTATGKQTFAPLTGHTDDSYTVEEFYDDINQSELYTGLKVGSMAVQLPATGLVTCDFSLMGKNLEQTGTSQYFTTPAAAGTNGIFASVSGAMVVNGQPVALITSMDFTVDRGLEAANVVGSNFAADIFTGRIRVNGNFSTYFQDEVFRDYFDDEAKISLVVALATGEENNADVVAFSFPLVKVGSATKNDGEMGIVQDHSFTALLNADTATGKIGSTILVQDTSLV